MKIRLLLVALVASLLIPLTQVIAQDTPGQGLEISPPLIELNANPGDVLNTEIKLRNITTGPLVVRAQINDFVAGGEDGQPKLLLEEGAEPSPYSIKDWLSTVPTVTLQPGEQAPLPITLTVPSDAGPGGHYGVVRFTATPPELEDTGVSLSASIGTLLLVNVSGEVTEQASFEEFYTAGGDKRRWLFEYGPINIIERLKNDGNVHFKPTGNVRVTNMFGRELAMFNLNEAGGNVLPQSIRKFEQKLDKRFLIGRYTVHADVVYGSNNTIMTQEITFWVIPYKLILLIIAAILLFVFIMKRYNQYIVRKAQKGKGGKK